MDTLIKLMLLTILSTFSLESQENILGTNINHLETINTNISSYHSKQVGSKQQDTIPKDKAMKVGLHASKFDQIQTKLPLLNIEDISRKLVYYLKSFGFLKNLRSSESMASLHLEAQLMIIRKTPYVLKYLIHKGQKILFRNTSREGNS